jgi:broad specificity phosphatase PhoE
MKIDRMTTLFLIRHGENDFLKKNILPGRLPDIHLNERGREQASELARTLDRVPFKAIYSSPLERAVETAAPLAQTCKKKVRLVPDLLDTDVGEWVGRSWKMLGRRKDWKVVQEAPSQFRFPGGESFVEAQTRVAAALGKIAKAHKDNELAAVIFHADPIKLAVAYFLGLPLDNFQRLSVGTGSVTILNISGQRARLLALNLVPPFPLPK